MAWVSRRLPWLVGCGVFVVMVCLWQGLKRHHQVPVGGVVQYEVDAVAPTTLLQPTNVPLPDVVLGVGVGLATVLSGTIHWAQKAQRRIQQVEDHNQGLLQKLTLHQQAELSLRQAEQQYRSIFEHATEGIFQSSQEGQFLNVNPALARIYGYGSAQELMDALSDIAFQLYVDPNRRAEFLVTMEREGVVTNFESQIYRADGEILWICENARTVPDVDGQLLCYEGTVVDITERKQAEEQLQHNALHDALTGLPNRLLLMDRLNHSLQLLKRRQAYQFAVLCLDLDRFKVINDSLGHNMGDQLLIEIADKLMRYLRPTDTISRLGGDEFTILLDDITDPQEASRIAIRIQRELQSPIYIGGCEVVVATSIGIATSDLGYERAEDMLRDADIALYRAKAAGRSRHQVFDKAMHAKSLKRLALETDLRRAIVNHDLQVYYQPILCLETGNLVGFEALTRWPHPQRGPVSPTEFIPIAEETGLIQPLSQWVLYEACHQLERWQQQFPTHPPLSLNLNLSGKQLPDPDFIYRLDRVLAETGLEGHNLKFEITETVMLGRATAVTQMLQELQARNIGVCIDDFGTGYCSLSYLHRFPVNTLKIDRSFVNRMDTSGNTYEIVRAIIGLAHNLGMEVVAEGIETHQLMAQLQTLGCDRGQGYLFSKPVPAAVATDLIGQATIMPSEQPA